MSFLSLRNVSKVFPDGTHAVRGASLDIARGEFVVLLGPSGCGKTTTLRMTAGLEIPTGGTITLDGRDVTALRPSQRDVGFVFQFYALYPHLSVAENILFPLKAMAMPDAQRRQRLAEVAARLGITGLLSRRPPQLSGGDQQRVSLARAMVRRPALYLMDEPLGTLDADRRLEMREFIRAQQLELQVTTIYVTHDQEEALSLADRVVVMCAGEIRQQGPPAEVYDRPADLFVANFVGSPGMNQIEGAAAVEAGRSVFRPRNGGAVLRIPRALPPGPCTLGIRPEHVALDPAGDVTATVVMSEYMGAGRLVHAEADFGRVIARADVDAAVAPGAAVRLRLEPDSMRFFDAQGVAL